MPISEVNVKSYVTDHSKEVSVLKRRLRCAVDSVPETPSMLMVKASFQAKLMSHSYTLSDEPNDIEMNDLESLSDMIWRWSRDWDYEEFVHDYEIYLNLKVDWSEIDYLIEHYYRYCHLKHFEGRWTSDEFSQVSDFEDFFSGFLRIRPTLRSMTEGWLRLLDEDSVYSTPVSHKNLVLKSATPFLQDMVRDVALNLCAESSQADILSLAFVVLSEVNVVFQNSGAVDLFSDFVTKVVHANFGGSHPYAVMLLRIVDAISDPENREHKMNHHEILFGHALLKLENKYNLMFEHLKLIFGTNADKKVVRELQPRAPVPGLSLLHYLTALSELLAEDNDMEFSEVFHHVISILVESQEGNESHKRQIESKTLLGHSFQHYNLLSDLHYWLSFRCFRSEVTDGWLEAQAAMHNRIMHALNGNTDSKHRMKVSDANDLYENIMGLLYSGTTIIKMSTLHPAIRHYASRINLTVYFGARAGLSPCKYIFSNRDGSVLCHLSEYWLHEETDHSEWIDPADKELKPCVMPTFVYAAVLLFCLMPGGPTTVSGDEFLGVLNSLTITFSELAVVVTQRANKVSSKFPFNPTHKLVGVYGDDESIENHKKKIAKKSTKMPVVLDKDDAAASKQRSADYPESMANKNKLESQVADAKVENRAIEKKPQQMTESWRDWQEDRRTIQKFAISTGPASKTAEVSFCKVLYGYYGVLATTDPEADFLQKLSDSNNPADRQYVSIAKSKAKAHGLKVDKDSVYSTIGRAKPTKPDPVAHKETKTKMMEDYEDYVMSKVPQSKRDVPFDVYLTATKLGMTRNQRRRMISKRFDRVNGVQVNWQDLNSVKNTKSLGAFLMYLEFTTSTHEEFISEVHRVMPKSCKYVLGKLGHPVPLTAVDADWVKDLSVDGDVELNPGPAKVYIRGTMSPKDQIAMKKTYVQVHDPIEQKESLLSFLTDVVGPLNVPQTFNEWYTLPTDQLVHNLNEMGRLNAREKAVVQHILDTRARKETAESDFSKNLAIAGLKEPSAATEIMSALQATKKLYNKVVESPEYGWLKKALSYLPGIDIVDDEPGPRPPGMVETGDGPVVNDQTGAITLPVDLASGAATAPSPNVVSGSGIVPAAIVTSEIMDRTAPAKQVKHEDSAVNKKKQVEIATISDLVDDKYYQVTDSIGVNRWMAQSLKRNVVQSYDDLMTKAVMQGLPRKDFKAFVSALLGAEISVPYKGNEKVYKHVWDLLPADNADPIDGAGEAQAAAHNSEMHATNGNIDATAEVKSNYLNPAVANVSAPETYETLYKNAFVDTKLLNWNDSVDGGPVTLESLCALVEEWKAISVRDFPPSTKNMANAAPHLQMFWQMDSRSQGPKQSWTYKNPISWLPTRSTTSAAVPFNLPFPNTRLNIDCSSDTISGLKPVNTQPFYAQIDSFFNAADNPSLQLNKTSQVMAGLTGATWVQLFQEFLKTSAADGFSFKYQQLRLWLLADGSIRPDLEVSSISQIARLAPGISPNAPASSLPVFNTNLFDDVTVQFWTMTDWAVYITEENKTQIGHTYCPPDAILAAGSPQTSVADAKGLFLNFYTWAPPCGYRTYQANIREESNNAANGIGYFVPVQELIRLTMPGGYPNKMHVILPGANITVDTRVATVYGGAGANANQPLYFYNPTTQNNVYSLQTIAASWMSQISYNDVLSVIAQNDSVYGCGEDTVAAKLLSAMTLRFSPFDYLAYDLAGTLTLTLGESQLGLSKSPLNENTPDAWGTFTPWLAKHSSDNQVQPMFVLPKLVPPDIWVMTRMIKRLTTQTVAGTECLANPLNSFLVNELLADTVAYASQTAAMKWQMNNYFLKRRNTANIIGGVNLQELMIMLFDHSAWMGIVDEMVRNISGFKLWTCLRHVSLPRKSLNWEVGTNYQGRFDPADSMVMFTTPVWLVRLGLKLAPGMPMMTVSSSVTGGTFKRTIFMAPKGWRARPVSGGVLSAPIQTEWVEDSDFDPESDMCQTAAWMYSMVLALWGQKYTHSFTRGIAQATGFYANFHKMMDYDYWYLQIQQELNTMQQIQLPYFSPIYYAWERGDYRTLSTVKSATVNNILYADNNLDMWHRSAIPYNNIGISTSDTLVLARRTAAARAKRYLPKISIMPEGTSSLPAPPTSLPVADTTTSSNIASQAVAQVREYVTKNGYGDIPDTVAAHITLRDLIRNGSSTDSDLFKAAAKSLDPELLSTRDLYKYGHAAYPQKMVFRSWDKVKPFENRTIPDNTKLRDSLARCDWDILATELRKGCQDKFGFSFNSGDPSTDRNLNFWLLACQPKEFMIKKLTEYKFGSRTRDELLLLLGPLSDYAKKWPQVFNNWCSNPKWLVDVKTAVGWMLTPEDAVSKTGSIYSIAQDLDRAQTVPVPSSRIEFYLDVMRAEYRSIFASLKHKSRYMPLKDFISDSDLWATDGIAGGVKLLDRDGKRLRVAKRGVAMVFDPDDIIKMMKEETRLYSTAFFKQDPAKPRVVFGSDWLFYIAWKWVEYITGEPFKSASFTSIGKEGLDACKFYSTLCQSVEISPTLPSDINNFDFRVESDLIAEFSKERLLAVKTYNSDVVSFEDFKVVEDYIIRVISNTYIRLLVSQEPNIHSYQNLVRVGISRKGDYYEYKPKQHLQSGLPMTASMGTLTNRAWANIVKRKLQPLRVSLTNDFEAGDDFTANIGSQFDAAAVIDEYEKVNIEINSAKCFVDSGRTEFLRMQFFADAIVGYPSRVITSTFEARPGAIREMTINERSSSLYSNLGILHARGCPYDLVLLVWQYYLSWLKYKYNIPLERVSAPAHFGGMGLGPATQTRFKERLPLFEYPKYDNYKMNDYSAKFIIKTEAEKFPSLSTPDVIQIATSDLKTSWSASIIDHKRLSDKSREYVKKLRSLDNKFTKISNPTYMLRQIISALDNVKKHCRDFRTSLEYADYCRGNLLVIGKFKIGRARLLFDAYYKANRGLGATKKIQHMAAALGLNATKLPYINSAFLLDLLMDNIPVNQRLDAFVNPKIQPIKDAILKYAIDSMVYKMHHLDKYQCWEVVHQLNTAICSYLVSGPLRLVNQA